MKHNFLDSNRQEHGVLGYEVSATQHNAPFVDGWFTRACGNMYLMDETRVSIRHHYSVGNRARWTSVYHYKSDKDYTVEVYDTVQIDGEFFTRTIYKGYTNDLKAAIHAVNVHKSDK